MAPEILAVGVPELTLMTANFAEAVDVPPISKSCVVIRSLMAPLAAENGDPPLASGKMPVTSDDARSTALDDRTPLESEWTMPNPPMLEKVIVPLEVMPVSPVIVPVAAILPLPATVNLAVPD